MSPALTAFLIYRAMAFLSGVFMVYLGYKLFDKGIVGTGGELQGRIGKNQVSLKKAAPGIFFALLGTLIILLSMYQAFYKLNPTTKEESFKLK